MKNVLFCIIVLLSLSCSNKTNIEKQLSKSELIQKHFTQADLPGLAKMIEFTDSLVLENSVNTDIDLAYHEFLDSLAASLKNGYMVSLDSKSVYPFLLSLDSTTFNKIWRVKTTFRRLRINDSIYINPDNFMHIGFNMGPFFDFTKELAAENKVYQGISESVEIAGDVSPSAWSFILNENKLFDYNKIDERLWISVNLLRSTEITDINTLKE